MHALTETGRTALVVPGLAVEEAVTTGGVVAGGDEGVEFALCAEEADEPAVGDNVADDVPFGVTGLRLQLLTSLKAGAPELSVVGVRVTVQVCVIGPSGLNLNQ